MNTKGNKYLPPKSLVRFRGHWWPFSDLAATLWKHLHQNGLPARWKIAGALLLALTGALALLSRAFAPEIPLAQRPILVMVVLSGLAGLVFRYLAELILHSRETPCLLAAILLGGALMRGAMFFSTPILEDDFYRYFWDGAVTAHGFNPYTHAPEQIKSGLVGKVEIPPRLLALARESGAVIERINHPYIRTIYPPLAQAAFALAYFISGGVFDESRSLAAWRMVLLGFDLAALLLLFQILRYLHLSLPGIAIYWLNPLLVKEIFNSGHMDILVFPFLLAAIWLAVQQKPCWAAALLALATGVKIWPAALLPLILRPFWPDYRRVVTALALFGILTLLLFLPILWSGFWNESSAFTNYTTRWQLNDSLFKILLGFSWGITKVIGVHPGHAQLLARFLAGFLLLGWIAYLASRPLSHPHNGFKSAMQHPQMEGPEGSKPATNNPQLTTSDPVLLFDRSLLLIAGMFLLLPNQFPWYGIWLAPLLAISPRKSLLWLIPLLSLYYLRYYFLATGKVEVFDYGIVWIEFIPLWALLFREWYLSHKLERLNLRAPAYFHNHGERRPL